MLLKWYKVLFGWMNNCELLLGLRLDNIMKLISDQSSLVRD